MLCIYIEPPIYIAYLAYLHILLHNILYFFIFGGVLPPGKSSSRVFCQYSSPLLPFDFPYNQKSTKCRDFAPHYFVFFHIWWGIFTYIVRAPRAPITSPLVPWRTQISLRSSPPCYPGCTGLLTPPRKHFFIYSKKHQPLPSCPGCPG